MIRVWEYLPELAEEKTEILAAVERVLDSGWLVLGGEGEAFEKEFSNISGCDWGVGVNSGTDALFIALKALGIGDGDEVITVSNTAVPTVSAIASTGATTRFVEIDPDTWLMDVSAVEAQITERTRCVIPVHLYGQCVPMGPLRELAAKHDFFLLEDCAQAHGATHHGELAGSMSDISAFSFYPTKILGAYGDAGMICGRGDELEASCKRLRKYGMEAGYYAEEHGWNSRLDEVQAAILRTKLARMDGYLAARRRIAAMYDELLADTELQLPAVAEGNEHSYYLYVVAHPRRDDIIAAMGDRGVSLNVSYPWPIHTMRGYTELGYTEGDLPITEKAQREIFSLPMYPTLTDAEVHTVVTELKATLAGF